MAHRISEHGLNIGRGNRKHLQVDQAKETISERGTRLASGHTLEDIEISLRVLIFNGGDSKLAAEHLLDVYRIKVHPTMLKKWAYTHFPDRYAVLQQELRSEVSEKIAGMLSENAQRATQTQAKIIDRLDENVNELAPKDLANAARQVAQAGALDIEKARLLRDEPTDIVENRDPEKILEALERLNVIPGTAKESTEK